MDKRKINGMVKRLNKYNQELDEMIGEIMSIKEEMLERLDNIPETLLADLAYSNIEDKVNNLREAEDVLVEIMDKIAELTSILSN